MYKQGRWMTDRVARFRKKEKKKTKKESPEMPT